MKATPLHTHRDHVSKGDRSWALKAFMLASLLWIAAVTALAVYADRSLMQSGWLALTVYGFVLLTLLLLALVAGGLALASLLTRRRGKRIAGAALLMVLPPLGGTLFFGLKLLMDRLM